MVKTPEMSLGDYIGKHAVDPAVAKQALQLTWPILQKARLSNYERPKEARFEPAEFKDAVFNATGKIVLGVQTLYQRNVFDCSDPAIRYGGQVAFNDSLAVALLDANWEGLKKRLVATYGRKSFQGVHEGLWACIAKEVAEPLNFQYWDNPFDGAVSTGGESLFTSLHYLLSSAMVGDSETVGRLDGLARLVTKWIPIGEIGVKPGLWLAVASAT